MDELLDIGQAAERLGLSKSRIRQLCGAGQLGEKVGSRWLIRAADLERFAQEPRPVGRPPQSARVEGEVTE